MKMNLKFKALSVLMSGLQDSQMWVIYQMASGKDMPDSVTKMDLINIIAFLFKQLDWIDANNVPHDTGNESTSSGGDDEENPASNLSELNEIVNEETGTQHFQLETYVDRESDPMEQESLSNDGIVLQHDTHSRENSFTEPSAESNQEHHEILSRDEDTILNIYENEHQGPEMDNDKAIGSEVESTAPLENYNVDRYLSFSCLKCQQKFSNKRNLAAHDFMKHQSGMDNISYCKTPQKLKRDLKQDKGIHTGDKPFSCSQCNYKCSISSNLKKHERIHTGGKPFSRSQKKHVRTHTGDKPFSCSQCDYKCSISGNLKTHERIHTGGKPFSCFQCDFKCNRLDSLKRHERTHTGDKPFCCSKCDYKFSTSGHLKRHVRRIHTGERPFSCSQCEYKCSTSDDLKSHLRRIHTGEKPFICSQCEYKCPTSSELKIHVRRIHTGDKAFNECIKKPRHINKPW